MQFFSLYDALLENLPGGLTVETLVSGACWALAETGVGSGLAMYTRGDSVSPLFPGGLAGRTGEEAARAVKSWNLPEASFGLAVVNACCNTPARLEALGCREREGGFYADGLDFSGKTVGMVGHMHGPAHLREQAKALYILEKEPQCGDYPDSACDWLLPQCDLVLITGSSLINKTLPHLLELCRNAYTILTGPSVPLCPALLDFGIDRLSGFVPVDRPGLRAHVESGVHGSPYRYGIPFTLKR